MRIHVVAFKGYVITRKQSEGFAHFKPTLKMNGFGTLFIYCIPQFEIYSFVSCKMIIFAPD